jgi:hypothetical protein
VRAVDAIIRHALRIRSKSDCFAVTPAAQYSRVDPSGSPKTGPSSRVKKLKVLHHFGHGSDGSQPIAGLINVNGTLYGTTCFGGSGCRSNGGHGTVFALSI